MQSPDRSKRLSVFVAIAGIFIEVVAIALLAAKRIPIGVATPFIITGMFLAFVPIFVVARRARRR